MIQFSLLLYIMLSWGFVSQDQIDTGSYDQTTVEETYYLECQSREGDVM